MLKNERNRIKRLGRAIHLETMKIALEKEEKIEEVKKRYFAVFFFSAKMN